MTNFDMDRLFIENEYFSPYRIIDENSNFYALEHRTTKEVIFRFKPNCNKKILRIYEKLTGEKTL